MWQLVSCHAGVPGKYKVEDAYALEERFATRPVPVPCVVEGCDPVPVPVPVCLGVRGDCDMSPRIFIVDQSDEPA